MIVTTCIVSTTLIAQVPTIGDVKGTSDTPIKINSIHKKTTQKALSNSNRSDNLLGFNMSGGPGGLIFYGEYYHKLAGKTFFRLSGSFGYSWILDNYKNEIGSVDIGVLRILKDFDVFEGENSIYFRSSIGPFLGFSTAVPIIGNINNNFNMLTHTGQDGIIFGIKSDAKLGYSVNFIDRYFIVLEAGIIYQEVLESPIPQSFRFAPEVTLGFRKYGLLSNW